MIDKQTSEQDESVYQRMRSIIFSGQFAPGEQLVERTLARELGVSRVPVRESLAQMVAQGLLVGGQKWQGTRMRNYSAGEIRQIVEYRAAIECETAAAAARRATDSDMNQLYRICEAQESEIDGEVSPHWGELDHQFHLAVARASRNERIYHSLDLLLAECHYLFYVAPARFRPRLPKCELVERMQDVVAGHRRILECIRLGDESEARRTMREEIDVEW